MDSELSVEDDRQTAETRPRRGPLRRFFGWCLRLVAVIFAGAALYFGVAEVTMRISVNSDADPMAGTIDVYFVSNGPHVDIVVPLVHSTKRWDTWLAEAGYSTAAEEDWFYAYFGWGDRDFYTKVPTWAELRPGIALRGVFLPTPTVMRVGIDGHEPKSSDRCHLVRLTPDAYAELCAYIEASFRTGDDGLPIDLGEVVPDQAEWNRFFEARGSYHLFRTCNTWTNDALKAAGQRAALWAPMSRGVQRQLPKNRGRR